MEKKTWLVTEEGFDPKQIEFFGSKFTIANGYFGYRGTLEEFRKEQLVACTMSELYDDAGGGWREIMNAPNGLYTTLECDGKELSVLSTRPAAHRQSLDLQSALHSRETVFRAVDGGFVTVRAQRFASAADVHLTVLRYAVTVDRPMALTIRTGFDAELWELNGPHYKAADYRRREGCLLFEGVSAELGYTLAMAQAIDPIGPCTLTDEKMRRKLEFLAEPGREYGFTAVLSLCKCTDCPQPADAAFSLVHGAAEAGWEGLLEAHEKVWAARWADFDVEIEGDDEGQLALRHSIFLLAAAAPFHTGGIAIPARGLSGQVYKGAMFWDTELYFLQMFLHCAPQVGRNLVSYRIKNLAGALKKAGEEGYSGAFYPWESQETGEEGCTYYNLTDIFTGRPVRTYFRDKQIHISTAAAYGILAYLRATGDVSLLAEGGAQVLVECAEFLWSYAYYKPSKRRFELLDVTGPDEYHERVNNNAYTNAMARETALGAVECAERLRRENPAAYAAIPGMEEKLSHARALAEQLYVPQPRAEDGVIPQYDGFFAQEDCTPDDIRGRVINPNEYLGSPTGLTVNTQVAKQADVVLLLSVLGDGYSKEIKAANWAYYEPRCEHGSSLSTCVYALLAAQIGNTDWAYRYFRKAAELDLKGNYKLYLGPLYIGGTHPAANGGSWMVAVQGFGGLTLRGDCALLEPHLPSGWTALTYRFQLKGQRFAVRVAPDTIRVTAHADNTQPLCFRHSGAEQACAPGTTIAFQGEETEK